MNKRNAQLIAIDAAIYGLSLFVASATVMLIISGGEAHILFGPSISPALGIALNAALLGPLLMLMLHNARVKIRGPLIGAIAAFASYALFEFPKLYSLYARAGFSDDMQWMLSASQMFAAIPLTLFGSLAGLIAERARRWLIRMDQNNE